ncbi:MAG: ATP-binding protein [Desulfohalobiaceae bacterium]
MNDTQTGSLPSLFQGLIENIPEGVVVVSGTGHIRFANAAAGTILSRSPTELFGSVFEHSLEIQGPVEIESVSPGGKVHAEMRVVPVAWKNETFAVVTLRDITSRKQNEKKLTQHIERLTLLHHITRSIAERQDLESIFNVLLDHLEDKLPVDFAGLWLADREGGTCSIVSTGPRSQEMASELDLETGTLINANQTVLDRNGYTEGVYIPDTSGEEQCWIAGKLSRAGLGSLVFEPLLLEKRLLGWLLVARASAAAFDRGELVFLRQLCSHTALAFRQKQLLHHLQKTTGELRRTQEEVLRQERLRALGQMASGIVHDINNALSPIVGYTDMLLEDDTIAGSPRAQKHLKHVRTAAGDIMNIVTRMRAFYRRHEDEDKQLPVDLNAVITQAVDLTRPRWKDMAQRRGAVIDVTTELDPELGLVKGVESELREAVTNLIINSVDAMDSGGSICLRTSRIGEQALLHVSDTGGGMDRTTQARCMEPFFTTKGEGGTGLGLAMVYGTVKRHRGSLDIESEQGRGTTISLTLPVHRARGESRQERLSGQTDLPQLRILCIDDEQTLRDLVVEMLEQEGHRVDTAASGEEGIAACAAALNAGKPFDVVLTDLGMPHLDGIAVTDELKRVMPQTPVILLTGWDQKSVETGEPSTRTDYILRKPPTLRGLRKALRHVLQEGTSPSGDG